MTWPDLYQSAENFDLVGRVKTAALIEANTAFSFFTHRAVIFCASYLHIVPVPGILSKYILAFTLSS